MIHDKQIAESINNLMLAWGKDLDASLADMQTRCSHAEFIAYRKAVGVLMADMLLEVMNPLYELHPDIKPEQLR